MLCLGNFVKKLYPDLQRGVYAHFLDIINVVEKVVHVSQQPRPLWVGSVP